MLSELSIKVSSLIMSAAGNLEISKLSVSCFFLTRWPQMQAILKLRCWSCEEKLSWGLVDSALRDAFLYPCIFISSYKHISAPNLMFWIKMCYNELNIVFQLCSQSICKASSTLWFLFSGPSQPSWLKLALASAVWIQELLNHGAQWNLTSSKVLWFPQHSFRLLMRDPHKALGKGKKK